MFNFIKKKLQKVYQAVSSKLGSLLGKEKLDQSDLIQLETILFEADVGVSATREIMQKLNERFALGQLVKGQDLKEALQQLLNDLLAGKQLDELKPVILFVGVNGSGKTTAIAKLANQLKQGNLEQDYPEQDNPENKGKKVLIAAADTFRAAATEQIEEWARKIGVDIVIGQEKQDPASVVYQACEKFKNDGYDYLLIDTAGRLQTKINLMNELAKIKRVIAKNLGEDRITTFLTVDSMLGQNSFDQAKIFDESTSVDGIILTKMDGTAKGGIVFAIVQELNIPIAYITFGEQVEAIKQFNAQEYIEELIGS